MEKQLKCVLLLSLKEMALRRVAVLLWSGSDISASVSKFKLSDLREKEWRETVDDKIKDKMLKLELPESLTKQMIDIIRPISLEVRSWKESQENFFWGYLNSRISLPDSAKLCWTTAGSIDYKKTAEELLRCNKLDVKQRYELACYYCLEDYISLYWEELPDEKKRKYENDKELSLKLPYCWPRILKGEHSELDCLARKSNRNLTTFNQFAFEHAAERCRKTAAKYFFQKLTPEEREASLIRAAHAVIADRKFYDFHEERSDILCYLLSVMTPKQQMEIIIAHPIDIFLCFLHWPLQDLIVENAGLLWTLFPPSSYIALLKKIIDEYEYQRLCFPKIFKEFFVESPPDLKKSFVDGELEYGISPACYFLSSFFNCEDSESIEVMFRNLDAADKVKLVFQRRTFFFFYCCMLEDGWHMLEVCLREAMLSKDEKGRLKDTFSEFLKRRERGEFVNERFKEFFEFLDETDASSDKRKKGRKRKLGNCSRE